MACTLKLLVRTQAAAAKAFPQELPYARAERLVSRALARAEALRQQFYAAATQEQRGRPSFKVMEPELARFCDAVPVGGTAGPQESRKAGETELDAALTRALLYCWVYFDEKCAEQAAKVRAFPTPCRGLVPGRIKARMQRMSDTIQCRYSGICQVSLGQRALCGGAFANLSKTITESSEQCWLHAAF